MTDAELDKPANGFALQAAIRLAPHLLWAFFLLTIFLLIGPNRVFDVLSRATKVGVAGVELEFRSEIDAVADSSNVELPPYVRAQLVRRIENLHPLIEGIRILWVDDTPANNLSEIGVMNRLGASIDLALSTNAAREKLSEGVYDIVISDMGRPGNPIAGLELPTEVAAAPLSPKLIFYSYSAVNDRIDTPPSGLVSQTALMNC